MEPSGITQDGTRGQRTSTSSQPKSVMVVHSTSSGGTIQCDSYLINVRQCDAISKHDLFFLSKYLYNVKHTLNLHSLTCDSCSGSSNHIIKVFFSRVCTLIVRSARHIYGYYSLADCQSDVQIPIFGERHPKYRLRTLRVGRGKSKGKD